MTVPLASRFSSKGLSTKLAAAFLAIGIVPAVLVTVVSFWSSSNQLSRQIGDSFAAVAEQVNDAVDRSLFERYGDAQAFAANPTILDRDYWYQAGSGRNAIAAAANRYVELYGIYDLAMVVDMDGRLIAVNDKDATGHALETAYLYERNFSGEPWFTDTVQRRFLTADGSALSGTVVEDVQVDPDVKRVMSNDGLVVTFTAPVTDATGRVVAVWHNKATFSLVEDIIVSAYNGLAEKGTPEAVLTLVDRNGRLLVEYAPHQTGNASVIHDMSAILSTSLREDNEAASRIGERDTGSIRVRDAQGGWNLTGFSPSKGALGYAGLGWGTLVAVDEGVALASVYDLRNYMILLVLASAVTVGLLGLWLGRATARPLMQGLSVLRSGAAQVAAAAGQVSSSAQSLSEGATEQAAALEQTSASMEEMASMTRSNAENAARAFTLMSEAASSVDGANRALADMVTSMTAIRESSHKVSKIIRTIDEIAFQTNILALNAAVEAARAGEAGMGFAVVADEVRSLAQRSAAAARDTTALIEESVMRSENGEARVSQVTDAIRRITAGVTEVKQLVEDVSAASSQQTQGVDQVTQAISQMEKVTQSSAATAEESAAASEQLNAQAEATKYEVGRLVQIVAGTASGVEDAEPHVSTPKRAHHPTAPARPARPMLVTGPKRPTLAPSRPSAEELIPFDDTGTSASF